MSFEARGPRISVVLPVRDGEAYLAEAVQSVLAQSFADFELIVVDDGSTDRTAGILSAIRDPRLRVLRLPGRQGLVAALNLGLRESRSEFIARMDADDICMRSRFARQVAYLEAHPDIAVCGTWTRLFGDRGGVHRLPLAPQQIRAHMFFGGAIEHPSIMMRRAFLEANHLAYDDDYRLCEDFDFLIRAAEAGGLANIPEALLLHRLHDRQVSAIHSEAQARAHERLLLRQLRSLLAADADDEAFHVRLARGAVEEHELARAERWLMQLEGANRASGRYDRGAFGRELRRCWFYAHRGRISGIRTLRSYWKSPMRGFGEVGLLRHLGLLSAFLFRAGPIARSHPANWRA